ncbi:MAG: hypothetical protein HKO59_01755 [Phycisphaerales bacterium]|nr:hypothetical protein [Phycisphaerales bacterium]
MQFVYGTRGTAEENRWASSRARADAEIFWYRGNGAIEVLPDTQFDAGRERDRSVVLYGNRSTNDAWATLLGDSPVQVDRDAVVIGEKRRAAADLGCLFLRPRPGSAVASVGVVSGTGVEGLRLTERLPYFVSGVAYPDLVLFGSSALETGADGVVAAGFFGHDWSVETGEIRWHD